MNNGHPLSIVERFIAAATHERLQELKDLAATHAAVLHEKLSSENFFFILHDEVENRAASLPIVQVVYGVMTENGRDRDRVCTMRQALFRFITGHSEKEAHHYEKLVKGEEESGFDDLSYEVYDCDEGEAANDDRCFYQRIINLGRSDVFVYLFNTFIIPYAEEHDEEVNFDWDSFHLAFAALVKQRRFIEAIECFVRIANLKTRLSSCDRDEFDVCDNMNNNRYHLFGGSKHTSLNLIIEENAVELFDLCVTCLPTPAPQLQPILLHARLLNRDGYVSNLLKTPPGSLLSPKVLNRYYINECLNSERLSEKQLRLLNDCRTDLITRDKFLILSKEGALELSHKLRLPLFTLLWEMLSKSEQANYPFGVRRFNDSPNRSYGDFFATAPDSPSSTLSPPTEAIDTLPLLPPTEEEPLSKRNRPNQ